MGSFGLMISNDGAIVGDDGPSHPPMKAILSLIGASTQAMPPFQDTDPSFDAIVPVATPFEPSLLFIALSFLRFIARLGQNDLLDAQLAGELFIVIRMNAP